MRGAPRVRSAMARRLARPAAFIAWLIAAALAAAPGRAGADGATIPGAAATPAARTVMSKVVYLAGASVYVEAGRTDGLAEGDTLDVLRGSRTIARLIVTAVSSKRAACDTFAVIEAPGLGDAVRFRVPADRVVGAAPSGQAVSLRPAAPDTAGAASDLADAGRMEGVAPPRGSRGRPWRGRLALRYLSVEPGSGSGYAQPALDVRVDGRGSGVMPLDLSIDVRSRRTYRGGQQDDVARVYRMLLAAGAPGSRRVTVGRQLSPALASVSVFDGVLVETGGTGRWSAGAFAGAQPEPARFRPSSDVIEGGAYAQARATQGPRRSWTLTFGGVHSLSHGQVNRQFGFVNGFYMHPRLTLAATQEIDLNTGWRRTMGDPALSFSSTFLSARTQIAPGLTLSSGYDGRRSVRLWRDRLTPETEFDDAYRRGVWSGLSGEAFGHVRLTLDGRWNGDGDQSWRSRSGAAELFAIPPFAARARWRVTTYHNDMTHGSLQAGGLDFDPLPFAHVEWSAGVRTSRDGVNDSRTTWQSVDADLHLTRRAYLMLSAEWDRGEGLDARQLHTGLSWLF